MPAVDRPFNPDKRLIERQIRHRLITREQHRALLDGLSDVEGKGISLAEAETQSQAGNEDQND